MESSQNSPLNTSGASLKTFDCIVIGFGGIGSWALYAAALKGLNVLGIDQFGTAHDRGSSHGKTRIIRSAYFEHPNYVPLAQESFGKWDELDRYTRANSPRRLDPLIQRTGLLQVGDSAGEVISGTLASANEHSLEVETLTADEITQRWPMLKVDPQHAGVLEAEAGLLRVENCVAGAISAARKKGAELKSNTVVHSWHVRDDELIEVETDRGSFLGKRLVISAGPWASGLLQPKGVSDPIRIDLKVVRKQQHWFQVDRVEVKIETGFPCFLFETPRGCFYGFPQVDRLGIKVAEHSGGTPVDDPGLLNRELDEQELKRSESFIDQTFIHSRRRLVHHSMCMYTMSADGHFVVDRHPNHSNVVLAAGMSGHGFKFAPVLGQHLIQLLDGKDDSRMEFLKLKRFH